MTVAQLRKHLERVLNRLDNYDDDQEVNFSCNTYGMSNYKGFLACPEGFIDLSDRVRTEDW